MNVLLPILLLALVVSCDRQTSTERSADRPVGKNNAERSADLPVGKNSAERSADVPVGKNSGERSADVPVGKTNANVPDKLEQRDNGIFSEFDDQLRLRFPSWLEGHHKVVMRDDSGTPFAYVDGAVAGPAYKEMGPEIQVVEWAVADPDDDGIPSAYDILLGAKKAAINAAPYKGGYQKLDYPGGDVPRTEGVCTDLLVRAVRNAGIDLQQDLHEDIVARPRAFPMVDEPDTNIDHRRVKTILPYFVEHWENLPIDLEDQTRPWLPGDIVFMNTMRDERPDHVGVVSDRVGESGHPLIINNWTDGYKTSEMDLLGFVPVTHRFRVRGNPRLPREHLGLEGLLKRAGLTVPEKHRQVVVVVGSHRAHAMLYRFTSDSAGLDGFHGRFVPAAGRVPVMVGAAGMDKDREGDKRAPTGVFDFGTAFSPDDQKPFKGPWPWRKATPESRWVDDAESAVYNTWVEGEGDFDSAENLSMYDLALVVEYNTDPTVPGRGSAIFLHTHDGGKPAATLGCTAMRRAHLETLVEWLKPASNPVLVQTPGMIF